MLNDACRRARRYAAGLGILGLCALGTRAEEPGPAEPPVMNETSAAVQTPETAVQDWPELPRRAALALIEKYGEPDLFDDDSLTWEENGPWQQTVVHREAPVRLDRYDSKDILEQTISYAVPDKKIAALETFDSRIAFDKETGVLTARSESESLNYLALNLADEIVNGKRTAGEASGFYRKSLRLAASGKTSAYMDGFLFPLGAGEANQRRR